MTVRCPECNCHVVHTVHGAHRCLAINCLHKWPVESVPTTPDGLPLLPSALLALALDDLIKVERSKRYMVRMGLAWHQPMIYGSKAVCSVCMAGVVMAKTLKVDWREDARPEDFTDATDCLLDALDEARDFHWRAFFLAVNNARDWLDEGPLPPFIDAIEELGWEVPADRYSSGTKGRFKRAMRKAIRIMQKHGL